MKHVLTAKDFTREWVDEILRQADELATAIQSRQGISAEMSALVYNVYLEASTRTHRSYERAARLLNCPTVNISGVEGTSLVKSESYSAMARMLAGYGADVITLRSAIEGLPRYLSEMLERYGYIVSIHNGGDGTNEHPSQAVLDALTIKRRRGSLEGLRIGFVGDLVNSRVTHSDIELLRCFPGVEIVLVSTPEVQLQSRYTQGLDHVTVTDDIEALRGCEFVQVLRVQRERFRKPDGSIDQAAYDRVRGRFTINRRILEWLGPDVLIMHPQPIADNEVSPEIWGNSQVIMDEQARLGVPARIALLVWTHEHLSANGAVQPKQPDIQTLSRRPVTEALARKEEEQKHFRRINNGTVIDHVPCGVAKQIYDLLDPVFPADRGAMVLSRGIATKRLEASRKDALVIENGFLTDEQMLLVAVLAPDATFNVIREGMITKRRVTDHTEIGIGRCPNSSCVTNNDVEAALYPRFQALGARGTAVMCHYCEGHFSRSEVIN